MEFNFAETNEAFIAGFDSGRSDYERMNGTISDGIPPCIVTNKILEDFLLAGLLDLRTHTENYTSHQKDLISRWYQSGVEKQEPNQSIALDELLEKNGIQIN
ncbi:hypothetical protein ACNQGP_10735 [Flavobacterium sp. GT2N3]|uniref:hypothetical protein n=1 Tax=unclassified Flavobacterium TaxID=196869 RepID=UPI003AAFCB18